jgi:histone H3/H4
MNLELSAASMERLLKKSGAQRVSDGAKKALCEVLVDYSDEICRKAIKLAKHGGRITIKDDDIKLAAKT